MLIAMAVYDTEENQKSQYTEMTIVSLLSTVNLTRHRLIFVNNASCPESTDLLRRYASSFDQISLIEQSKNIGTARAINQAWLQRQPFEHCVKMDNDVVINYSNWADEIQTIFDYEPTIGILALKRKDLEENPDHFNQWYRSKLTMLPHIKGTRWWVIEEVLHTMGTCQAFNSSFLEKCGYLYQMGALYGFDDSLACVRAKAAGFRVAFLPYVNIDHIDPGTTEHQQWKQDVAGQYIDRYQKTVQEYESGRRPVWQGPDDD